MRAILTILFVVAIPLKIGVIAWAQGTAQISGVVRDPSGAVLPGVEVIATQTATGVSRTNQILPDIYKDKSGRPNTQWLNPAAFAIPAPGTLGNSGRGIVKLPLQPVWQDPHIVGSENSAVRSEVFVLTFAVITALQAGL